MARPGLEILEHRVNPSTYLWTGLGDGQTWNDASNWDLAGSSPLIQQPTVPTPYSDVIFPPTATLPAGSSTTINFNFAYLYMPLDSLAVEGSYTFTGNPIKIESSLSVVSPFTTAPDGATAIVLLTGLELAPGALFNTGTGSTLQLGSAANPTGLQLTILGGVTKAGGGELVVDTRSVLYSNAATLSPIPVTIAGGSIILGASANLGGMTFQIGSGSALVIADNVVTKVQALTGSGLVDLDGTTNANDQTSLTVAVPNATTDQFSGFIDGVGQFVAAGNGTLTTGTIDFSGEGSIQILAGTLDVDGSISAGTLQVYSNATLGGLGMWTFSATLVFQTSSTFDVTLNGTDPGTQYTQLVDSDATSGVDIGYSNLAATLGYEYEQGDHYTIISAPMIEGAFQNVVGGRVVVAGTVPLSVNAVATAVTLTPLQSLTTTGVESSENVSYPGVALTFTASVSTRTAPVSSGSVSFMSGATVLATASLGPAGTAVFSTTSLPLGSNIITAIYQGTGTILASASPALAVSVIPYQTATIVTSSANPGVFGRPVTFTASIFTNIGTVVSAGTITFRRGKRLLASEPVDSGGSASLTMSSLAVGTTGIQAIYSGTASDVGSVSAVYKQTIGASPTTTSLSISVQTVAGGRTKYFLVATVSAGVEPSSAPTGTVIFREKGKVVGSARLRSGVATLVVRGRRGSGPAKFMASFARNTRFRASSSPAQFSG